jgi:hypothetical protein
VTPHRLFFSMIAVLASGNVESLADLLRELNFQNDRAVARRMPRAPRRGTCAGLLEARRDRAESLRAWSAFLRRCATAARPRAALARTSALRERRVAIDDERRHALRAVVGECSKERCG